MAKEFELRKEIALDATPEQVWDAIATGPGITSWFMTHEVEPGEGGKVVLSVGDFTAESVVTGWDPPRRFEVRGGADGTGQAFEYLIEGREGGSTVLRFVQSGFAGDDWETEYEAMSHGWDMYFHTLAQYLTYFPGRTATYVLAEGPPGSAGERAWQVLLGDLGLTGAVAPGDPVRVTPDGLPPLDGVVDYTGPTFLGVRTADGLYRFHGRAMIGMPLAVGHHVFADVDRREAEEAWRTWLHGLFA
ncbi:SRPBCC family protein [Planosporangium sp. 12N6]|uniref:SRPBCC family protein n=1 Tax=Planosporangium spinosum TaxID=3402278 RepID=UPI003CEDF8A1